MLRYAFILWWLTMSSSLAAHPLNNCTLGHEFKACMAPVLAGGVWPPANLMPNHAMAAPPQIVLPSDAKAYGAARQ